MRRLQNFSWNKKIYASRSLVVGGSGFIGTEVVNLLLEYGGAEIIILQRSAAKKHNDKRVRSFSCDLRHEKSPERVRRLGVFDFVFNLAGVTDQRMPIPEPRILFDANVTTLIHLTQGIHWEKVRGAVHIGSNAEYGNCKLPHREDMLPQPTNLYGWAKVSATQYAQVMSKNGLAKWCVARPFFVYGPGATHGLISHLIRTFRSGGTFTVQGKTVTRDPVHVADVAEGLVRLAACRKAEGEVVNICRGKELSLIHIAHRLHDAIGLGRIAVEEKPRAGDFIRSRGSANKLAELTGWTPGITFATGLKSMLSSEKTS